MINQSLLRHLGGPRNGQNGDRARRGERVEAHGGTERKVACYSTRIIDLTLVSNRRQTRSHTSR